MTASVSFDVIVIGLGAMGSAAAYQLARRGLRVLGIDRFTPPHSEGSSHGQTRITRLAIGEGAYYVPLVLRSHEIWRELEAQTGEKLLLECGHVSIDGTSGNGALHGKASFFERIVSTASQFNIAHELLTADEMRYRYPQFSLYGGEQVYFEPGGGLVFPEKCIAAQLAGARRASAVIANNETVTGFSQNGNGVTVATNAGTYHAGHAVVTAGGWAPGLVGSPLGKMRLLRQVLHWFAPSDADMYGSAQFPTFIWMHGARPEDSFYGFPMVPGLTPGVKMATEQYSDADDVPEAMDWTVSPAEAAAMYADHVQGRLNGLTGRVERSTACFYTQAPDADFVLDHAPGADRIVVVSACSGHGFKHSAGIGESIADMVTGQSAPAKPFAINRPSLTS